MKLVTTSTDERLCPRIKDRPCVCVCVCVYVYVLGERVLGDIYGIEPLETFRS